MAWIFHGFWWILEAKLSQVGMQNRAKIDQKAHGKYDEKKKASWRRLGASWAPKNPLHALTPLEARRGGGYAEAPLKDSLGFLLVFLRYILGIY